MAPTEDIETIDLERGLKYKDFGKGFYLHQIKLRLYEWPQRRHGYLVEPPTLITYELSESALSSGLRVKIFPEKACVEWFLFVDANRDRQRVHPIHDYDIVIGPIADDGVVLQLTNYREGIYSPEQAAQLLQDKYLDQQ